MKVDNLETNFLDEGEGQVVLLLHGWGGTSLSVLGLANDLSSRFRIIAPDLWGFGKSEMPSSNYNVTEYARSVKHLLNELNIEKCCVVGHSFGGRIAIALCAMFPEVVDSLVLIDSAGIKPKFSLNRYFKIRRYKKLKKKVDQGILPNYVLDKFGSVDYQQLVPEFRQVFVNVVNEDLTNYISKINKKTLILWGKHDKDTPPYMAKVLHKRLKCSKLSWLEGGHFAYLTKQAECLKFIYEFLEVE